MRRPTPSRSGGAIEFRHLTFAYDTDHGPVLKDINLQIPAGTVCGIVGATGAGKSTLVNLLLRLYEPEDQTVLIDGIDIKQMARRRLEEAVGYVSQEIFLFSGSVRDNILFGAVNGAAERVEEAARIAQLLPTIQLFGAGLRHRDRRARRALVGRTKAAHRVGPRDH